MRLARRYAEVGCDGAPNNDPKQRSSDRRRVDNTTVNDSLTNRGGYGCTGKDPNDIEHHSHRNSCTARHDACRDYCGNRVGSVGPAVDEFGGKDENENEDEYRVHRLWLSLFAGDRHGQAGDVVTSIGHILELLEDGLPHEDGLGIVLMNKDVGQTCRQENIALLLQILDA